MRTTVQTMAAVLALALAASALAAGERAEMSIPFKATTPRTETGLNLDLRYYNPENRDEKPPVIQELAIHLPQGTRLDPSAVPVCQATNEDFQARGRDACPPETQVGTGKLWVYLGAPGDPQPTDLALFNGPGQLIELLLFEGTNNTAALERLTIENGVMRAKPAQVPPVGPPENRAAASRIVWDIPARGGYLVTPPTCDGTWTTVGEFSFGDGGSTRVEFAQPCEVRRVDTPPVLPPAVTIHASPRTLVRGRETRIRVRLESTDPACVRGATIRLGTRSAVTDDQGRATLVGNVRFLRRPWLRESGRCQRARTRLRTVRR
ncbi:MAG TPA: hypothetical protein VF549_12470 [Solirubrobacteraceae bacterium]|jgi:hypothetical protein